MDGHGLGYSMDVRQVGSSAHLIHGGAGVEIEVIFLEARCLVGAITSEKV